jgi:hypothetical protein
MKPDLEKIKEYTQKTSLTQEEKFAMLGNIRNYADAHPVKTPSYSVFFKHSFTYASIAILIIGTTATSFAAEQSLPGDILYPIKTGVNEKIAKTLSVTRTQKAKVNVKLVDKRMEELTEMVVKEKDTPEKIDTIVAQLEENKKELQNYIAQVEVNNSEDSEDALEIYTELESVVDAHLDILEDIAGDTDAQATLANIIDSVDITASSPTPVIEEPAELNTLNGTSTQEEITGEEDAVSEVLDFSAELEPILIEAKSKIQQDINEATPTRIRADVRKRIIEKAEEELRVEIEE